MARWTRIAYDLGMADARQVTNDALDLDLEERTRLALRLLDSVEAPDPHGHLNDEELAAELRRRVEAVERGEAATVSWEQVRDRLRQRLGR